MPLEYFKQCFLSHSVNYMNIVREIHTGRWLDMTEIICTALVTALVFTIAITQRIKIFKILKNRADYRLDYIDKFL